MITAIETILAATMYRPRRAFILFIYRAYTHAHQKNLLMLSIGMSIFISGSNFDIFTGLVLSDYIEEPMARTIALLIEIPDILVMLYSAIMS